MKSFHIKDIVPISCNQIMPLVWGTQPVKYKKEQLSYQGKLGVFRIEFSDNSIIMAAYFQSGIGRNIETLGLFATNVKTMYNYKKLRTRTHKRNQKPGIGFYRVHYNAENGLAYEEIAKPTLVETVHPVIPEVIDDMTFFLQNVNLFTKYNMPGTRKVMLIGPPGTGKTSLCTKIARDYLNKYSVVISTCIESIAHHLKTCSLYNLPTIVIIEDAESTLNNVNYNTSTILNFLDGVDQPVNKGGAYVIMTTNRPDAIEPRILKRPGRIDRIFQVGVLKDDYAINCAKLYFDKELTYSKPIVNNLQNIVSGMTGAQIKELALSTRAYCASNRLKITTKNIRKVADKLTEDISDAVRFAEDNSLMTSPASNGVGFKRKNDLFDYVTKN